MSTELIKDNLVKVTRFWGGEKRGVCFYVQIDKRRFHEGTRDIDITETEFIHLIDSFKHALGKHKKS